MNEHTVLCACLLRWVRPEAVSCPESWRSTAPISNRKYIFVIPRRSELKHTAAPTCEQMCHTPVLDHSALVLLVSPSPWALPALGAAVAHMLLITPQGSKKSSVCLPLLHLFHLHRYRPCVPAATTGKNGLPSVQVKAPTSSSTWCRSRGRAVTLRSQAKEMEFQDSDSQVCVAAGPLAWPWDQAMPDGAAQTWQHVAAASCRSQDHFMLHDADYRGEFLCAKWQYMTILEQAAW